MADKNKDTLIYKAAQYVSGKKLTDKDFSLPENCDFLAESFSMDFFNNVTKETNDATFYLETPLYTTPGFYETDQIFILKAVPYSSSYIKNHTMENQDKLFNIAKEAEVLNKNDGDTIYFFTDTIQSGMSTCTIGNTTYEKFENLINPEDNKNNSFGLRFLGMNTPEIPHYSTVILEDDQIIKKSIKEVTGFNNYIYRKYDDNGNLRTQDTIINFCHDESENTYYEIEETSFKDSNYNLTQDELNLLENQKAKLCKMVYIDSSNQDVNYGLEAKNLLEETLGKAEDLIIMADYKTLNKQSNYWQSLYNIDFFNSNYNAISTPFKYVMNTWNKFFSAERYKYLGYNVWGQDNNKRLLGAVYIKLSLPELNGESAWINLNKYMIYKMQGHLDVLPDYSSDPRVEAANGFCSDAFKLWTYDINTRNIVDVFTNYTDAEEYSVKNRDEVLNIVTGKTYDTLKKYTVILGDNSFIIPPTSIRMVTQNQSKTVKLLRSRGSVTKTTPKSEKILELQLYFNNESAINGIPYEVTHPNGITKSTYYMNGLRSLIAQFRLTPFLPIDNEYINESLNIYAVTLVDLQVNTMPGFPKCLQATLTLQEFNHSIYMPELPLPNDISKISDLSTNPFARTIHYPLMRYYYQRLLEKGNMIQNYDFNSDEYLKATYGNRTALIPMQFNTPRVEFYLPDKQWLDKRLEAAMEKEKALVVNYELTDEMKNCISQMAPYYDKISNMVNSSNSDFHKILADVKKTLIVNSKYDETIWDSEKNKYITTNQIPLKLMLHDDQLIKGCVKTYYHEDEEEANQIAYDMGTTILTTNDFKGYLTEEEMDLSLDKVAKAFNQELGLASSQIGTSIKHDTLNNKTYYNMYFSIPLPAISTEAERSLFKKEFITKFELTEEDELFEYNSNGALCIKLPITFTFNSKDLITGKNNKGYTKIKYNVIDKITVNMKEPGYLFLNYCNQASTIYKNEDGDITHIQFDGDTEDNMQQEVKDLNSYNYLDEEDAIKFIKYEFGEDIIIESLSCIYSNGLSRMSLNGLEGYAHQYCGGQDTIIEIRINTKDPNVVSMLSSLPSIAAQYAIDYRTILACWPLRINSEITRLFGVNEVLVESVDTSTVPNYPGLYAINMRFISVDRSTRNRETLKKIEDINNSGSIANGNAYNMKSYFDIKTTLGKAEIYPDLELPTLDELSYLKYDFIRYHSAKDNTRKFVDPDFYFIYAHQLTHEILRSGLMRIFSESGVTGIDNVFNLTDSYGAKQNLKYNPIVDTSTQTLTEDNNNLPYTTETANDLAKTEDEQAKNTNNNAHIISYENISKNIFNEMDHKTLIATNLAETLNDLSTPIWYLTKDFSFPLREKCYELATDDKETHDAYIESISSIEEKMLNHINQELSNPIDLSKYGKKNLTIDKYSKAMINDAEKVDTWVTDAVTTFINKFVDTSSFLKLLVGEDKIDLASVSKFNTHLKDLILGYADAMTGYSYCNEAKTIIALSTEDDKNSKKSWKFKMFLNTIDDFNDEKIDSIEDYMIPYCKVKDPNDSSRLFANSLTDAINNGYAFGMYQITMLDKNTILKFVDNVEEKKLIQTSKDSYFFLDPYYRNLQLTDPKNKELTTYKTQLLIDPTYSTLALIRHFMIWYKKLIEDDLAISLYEILKNEADEVYSEAGRIKYLPSEGKVSKEALNQTLYEKDNSAAFEDNAKSILNQKIQYYIEAYVSKYHELYNDDETAFTDTGLEDNAVPEDFREFVKKGSNKTSSLKDKYQKLLDEETYDEFDNETLNVLLGILKTEDTSELVSYGTSIATYKQEIENKITLNISCFNEISKQLKTENANIVLGKIMGLAMLNLENGYKIYDCFKDRDIAQLNSIMMSLPLVETGTVNSLYKKYLMALDGRGVLQLETIGQSPQTAEQLVKIAAAEKVYIQRSNDVAYYLKDSFLDMILNDKRGRMLRAFPTYYMLFIDEGRKIGLWKLHDNFYNMNAISEISVTKSRKIAADTAQIQMSNMFKTFSQDDPQRDYNLAEINTVRYNMRDAFNSIFSPRTYYIKEELLRQMQESPKQSQLNPGIRIHLRMGYGANAAELPIVFNGCITEVGTSDVVDIVAQGDGVELLNPIIDIDDAEDIANEEEFIVNKWVSNWLTNGATPREILTSILSAKGSWLQDQIRTMTAGRFFNTNPYGIVHFGDAYYDKIFIGGEPVQNIFEANAKATYGTGLKLTGLEPQYNTKDTPKISLHVYGKTLWDIMHVCASAQPDYITSIAPFGMRSTLFYGNGRNYYAYDYERTIGSDNQELIVEKRKPFQQQHIFTSYTDIIHNNISASAKNIKTAAVGLYQETMLFGAEKTKQVGPLYVDFSIYPEFQKSMTVDSQLWAKGIPIMGNMLGITAELKGDDVGGTLPNPKEIAWRMTASALKNSMKEMYNGELTVIGYPSIKPYDRMWLSDVYERMEGQCEIEAVVHNFNSETGFTTSLYADCISVIDDMQEQYAHNLLAQGVGMSIATATANILPCALFYKTGKPLLKNMTTQFTKGAKTIAHAAETIGLMDNTLALKAKDLFGNVDDAVKTIFKSKNLVAVSNIALFAAETIVIEVLGAYCSEYIYRYLQNLQVLQVYPLKRKGRVMIAGLDGHKGLVVGSPTENMEDDWTNFCISMFDGKTTGFGVESIINFMFGNNKIHHLANSMRKDADMPTDDNTTLTKDALIADINADIADIYINQAGKDKKTLLTMPRIQSMGQSSVDYLKHYKIDYDEELNTIKSYDITHKTFPIQYESGLQKYFNIDFINIFNEKEIGQANILNRSFNFSGKQYDIEYYKNNEIINIPVLRFEAMTVLIDCIDILAKRFKITDMNTKLSAPEVYITSATVLGGKMSWESTGFGFRLQVASYDTEQMLEFKDEVIKYYKDTYNNDNLLATKQISGSKEILFVVKPPISKLIEGSENIE